MKKLPGSVGERAGRKQRAEVYAIFLKQADHPAWDLQGKNGEWGAERWLCVVVNTIWNKAVQVLTCGQLSLIVGTSDTSYFLFISLLVRQTSQWTTTKWLIPTAGNARRNHWRFLKLERNSKVYQGQQAGGWSRKERGQRQEDKKRNCEAQTQEGTERKEKSQLYPLLFQWSW